MTQETQELEFESNQLYRGHYRVALGGVILMSIVTIILTGILVSLTFFTPQPKYFATTTTGVEVPLHSLSEPVITKPYLLQWASLATRKAYNLSFDSYQKQINAVKPFFTPNGFAKLKEALKKSGLLDEVINKKLVMSAVVDGDPVIVKEYKLHGAHTWEVQLPLLVSFESASENRKIHTVVGLRIQRVPVLSAEKGIQISDFVAGSMQ